MTWFTKLTGVQCNYLRPCLPCMAYGANCEYSAETASAPTAAHTNNKRRNNGLDAAGERYARHLLRLVENTLPAIQSVGFQRVTPAESAGPLPTYHPIEGIQPLRRLSQATDRGGKHSPSLYGSTSASQSSQSPRRPSVVPRASPAERSAVQQAEALSGTASGQLAPPSVATR